MVGSAEIRFRGEKKIMGDAKGSCVHREGQERERERDEYTLREDFPKVIGLEN